MALGAAMTDVMMDDPETPAFPGRPANGHFLVQRDSPEDQSEAGLAIPSMAQDVKNSGTVVSVGDHVASWIEPGVRLLWKFDPPSISIGAKEYLVMYEREGASDPPDYCFIFDADS